MAWIRFFLKVVIDEFFVFWGRCSIGKDDRLTEWGEVTHGKPVA